MCVYGDEKSQGGLLRSLIKVCRLSSRRCTHFRGKSQEGYMLRKPWDRSNAQEDHAAGSPHPLSCTLTLAFVLK